MKRRFNHYSAWAIFVQILVVQLVGFLSLWLTAKIPAEKYPRPSQAWQYAAASELACSDEVVEIRSGIVEMIFRGGSYLLLSGEFQTPWILNPNHRASRYGGRYSKFFCWRFGAPKKHPMAILGLILTTTVLFFAGIVLAMKEAQALEK